MKRYGIRSRLVMLLLFLGLTILGECEDVRGQPVVFPGAQGFGIETPAGRGGRIIRVTNLNANGPGSLREAVLGIGPRVVVFEVGGVIDLRWVDNFFIVEPYLTVAGQTAPSPGITIIRGTLQIYTNDILIQHLRFRRGIEVVPEGLSPGGDCLSIWADANDCNIVIDHCSFAWGTDETLSIMGSIGPLSRTHNITFSNCIIAEALTEYGQSCGSLIGNVSDIAVIGNLYANNASRNPIFSGDTTGVIVNNVVYDPMIDAIELGPYAGPPEYPPSRSSVVGNVLIPGVDTYKPHLVIAHSSAKVYLEDNIVQGFSVPPLKGGVISLAEKPLWPSGLKALPASEVVRYVATHAGARPMDRDEVDKRIIQQMLDGTGRIIRTQEEVGGYPTLKMTRCRLTIPQTDIDTWLALLGSVPSYPDLNGDLFVDLRDFARLAQFWSQNEMSVDLCPLIARDSVVDARDLAILSQYWLEEVGGHLSLLARWRFDEREGSVVQDSAGNHEGSIIAKDPLWRPGSGKIRGALQLDGIDDYVSTSFALNPAEGPFSIFVWIKGGAPAEVILSQVGGTNWLMAQSPEGHLTTELKGTGRMGWAASSTKVITDGQWHEVGLTWDGSERILYIDGVGVVRDVQANLMAFNGALRIGAGKRLEQDSFWSGLIDDVRVYDRAISSITNESLEGFEDGFKRLPWSFEQGSLFEQGSFWRITSSISHSGRYSAMAGEIGNGERSSLAIRLDCGTGQMSFWRKVSSENNYDFLEFAIDGKTKVQWSGELDWEEVSFDVAAGIRTFTWTYVKDETRADGEDTAWIDDIHFPVP